MPNPVKSGKKSAKLNSAPSTSTTKAGVDSAAQKPPSWPPFKPTLPVADLTPTLHSSSPKLALVSSFFPRSLCRDYVTFLKTLPFQTTPSRPKRGEAVRVNDRFQVRDPGFAKRLWDHTGLKEAILERPDGSSLWGGQAVGLSPNIRVYRYSKGQYFDCHYDDYNDLSIETDDSPTPVPVRTTWTLLLYLTSASEGCQGGETVFYTHDRKSGAEEIVVPPETGTLLLHKHGDACLLHEGREVLAGEKWILRTDLCIRR